jgi:hypothetical protein
MDARVTFGFRKVEYTGHSNENAFYDSGKPHANVYGKSPFSGPSKVTTIGYADPGIGVHAGFCSRTLAARPNFINTYSNNYQFAILSAAQHDGRIPSQGIALQDVQIAKVARPAAFEVEFDPIYAFSKVFRSLVVLKPPRLPYDRQLHNFLPLRRGYFYWFVSHDLCISDVKKQMLD